MKIDPHNILVLDFGQLGDVVLSLPALAAIRRRFPKAQITSMGGLSVAQVIEMSGAANRVVGIDRVTLRDSSKWRGVLNLARLVAEVRRGRYDLVIDLHSLAESNLLGYFSGAPLRVFAQRGGRSLDLLATMRTPWEDRGKHLVDRYLDVLVPLGVTGASRMPHLPTRLEDDDSVRQMLEGRGVTGDSPLAGLFPGGSRTFKRWALERFAELASRLEKNDGARIVVFLGPEETEVALKMRATFSPSALVLDGLTLSQVASVAAKLNLLVSNDSGPMHLAAAVGTPVVLLLGAPIPGPYWFGPVGEQHRIIVRKSLAQISVAEVYAAARAVLQAGSRNRECALTPRK